MSNLLTKSSNPYSCPWHQCLSGERYRPILGLLFIIRNKILVGSDKKWEISPQTPIIKIAHFFYRHDVTKVGDFYNWGLWEIFSFFVGSNWNFVSGYIKNVDTLHESFSYNQQVIKKLSPKSLWQTYMKWTVVIRLCITWMRRNVLLIRIGGRRKETPDTNIDFIAIYFLLNAHKSIVKHLLNVTRE